MACRRWLSLQCCLFRGLRADRRGAAGPGGDGVGRWAVDHRSASTSGHRHSAVILLTLVRAVPDLEAALYGFSQPVPYFLIGVLTLGMGGAAFRAGEPDGRVPDPTGQGQPARALRSDVGVVRRLDLRPASATTRGAILVHVYEQGHGAMEHREGTPAEQGGDAGDGIPKSPGSTALLAGGITPVVASSLIGDFSWTRWFVLMALPFWAILAVGGLAVFVMYRSGFSGFSGPPTAQRRNGVLGRSPRRR